MNPALQAAMEGLKLHQQNQAPSFGGGQQELATLFGKFIAGEMDAASKITSYYALDRYSERSVNPFLERTIANTCKDLMFSPLVTDESKISSYVSILEIMSISAPEVIKGTDISAEKLGELYYRFPNTANPNEESAIQKKLWTIADQIFKTDEEQRLVGKAFLEPNIVQSGTIFYPPPGKRARAQWDASLLAFEKELVLAGKKLHVKLIKVEGRNLVSKDSNGKSDPFFQVNTGSPLNFALDDDDKLQWKSSIKKKTLNPDWDMTQEKHDTIKAKPDRSVFMTMYDEDLISKDFMGYFQFEPAMLYALQEKVAKGGQLKVILQPQVREKKLIGKDKYDFSITGYLVVTMQITQVSNK